MSLRCGIVGLPNVGKSTLFNALLGSAKAKTGNYAFCTTSPNVGMAEVADHRLPPLAKLSGAKRIVPAVLEFTDIAGLVKGAAQGEGLGNQFLAHIREVDAVAHVLRCFDNREIQHVTDRIDPVADLEVVRLELMLADLAVVEKRLAALQKQRETATQHGQLLEEIRACLVAGKSPVLTADELDEVKELRLLTVKPAVYLCNLDEQSVITGNRHSERLLAHLRDEATHIVMISSQIESEIAQISDADERRMFLRELGLHEAGLGRVARCMRDALHLLTFFTTGTKEARAWQIPIGSTTSTAAGKIHSDFQTKFIRAEVTSYNDYVTLGPARAKEKGLVRFEGQEYIVQEGDVIYFHHS